jgi:hypothetical protein
VSSWTLIGPLYGTLQHLLCFASSAIPFGTEAAFGAGCYLDLMFWPLVLIFSDARAMKSEKLYFANF